MTSARAAVPTSRATGAHHGALLRVCVTGPESTGKSTLAARLAEAWATVAVPEASRLYAERVGRPLRERDVGPIAREHLRLANEGATEAMARGARLLVLDTDLVSTVVYARHYYRTVPAWVLRAERVRRADLYLLCDVDVPWVHDGVRDRPAGRRAMFAAFQDALARRHAPVAVIRGDWEERWRRAGEAVAALACV